MDKLSQQVIEGDFHDHDRKTGQDTDQKPLANSLSRFFVECSRDGEEEQPCGEDHGDPGRQNERTGNVEAPKRGDRAPDDERRQRAGHGQVRQRRSAAPIARR